MTAAPKTPMSAEKREALRRLLEDFSAALSADRAEPEGGRS